MCRLAAALHWLFTDAGDPSLDTPLSDIEEQCEVFESSSDRVGPVRGFGGRRVVIPPLRLAVTTTNGQKGQE